MTSTFNVDSIIYKITTSSLPTQLGSNLFMRHPAILLQITRTIAIAIARRLLPTLVIQPNCRSPYLVRRVPVRRHEVDTDCIRPRRDHEARRDHHRGRGSFGVRLRQWGLQSACILP